MTAHLWRCLSTTPHITGQVSGYRPAMDSPVYTIYELAEYERAKAFFSDAVIDPVHEFGLSFMASRKHPTSEDDTRLVQDPAIAAAIPRDRRPASTMFVTIGATASFKGLIVEVLSDKFLQILADCKFDRLIVQCGPDLQHFENIRPKKGFDSHWIHISGFDYTDDIRSYMAKCTPHDGEDGEERRSLGIIVSHAGAGTILDALSINAKLIAVPNSTLMDNHQVEFAKEMDRQGYLVQGTLGRVHEAVERIEEHLPAKWPPQPPKDSIYSGGLEEICVEVNQNEVPTFGPELGNPFGFMDRNSQID